MDELVQRVLDFIQHEGLILADADTVVTAGSRVVLVGVSGGPDSVCLLHVLDKIRQSLGLKLHVAHLNHLLRGEASDEDARYVERLCKRLKIPVTVEAADVELYRGEHKLSLEEAAREVRYDFFARIAESTGAECVALGHTEDDQVETVLMHLVRGTGIAGLRGMLPVSYMHPGGRGKLRVIRPLLEVSRDEINEYCSVNKLNPRIDATNDSLDYARNRFRHGIVPILRKSNSNIGAAIRRVTRSAADDLSFIDSELDKVWDDVICVNPAGTTINTAAVLVLHPALQRHLFRRVLREALGDLVNIEAVHIEKMQEALHKPAGKRISLFRGLQFYVSYDACLLTHGSVDVCSLPEIEGVRRIKVPGVTLLNGWRVKTDIVDSCPRAGSLTACMDADAIGTELTVRSRRPGDRFQPLGMRGSKKLQDFMVDAKIPVTWRDRIPLVCSNDDIMWVVGWRISDKVKTTAKSGELLRITFETNG